MKHAVINFIPALAVDELAELLAQIAPLQKRADDLKEQLKATGLERIIGTKHEAVVSLSERETMDTKRLREDLGEALLAPYLRSTLVTTLKVTARKVH
jgi:hypothetical protein